MTGRIASCLSETSNSDPVLKKEPQNIEQKISNVEGCPSLFCGFLFEIRFFPASSAQHHYPLKHAVNDCAAVRTMAIFNGIPVD